MAWELTGNAGSDPNTNFLGTRDTQPLVIKTNGVEVMRVTPDGRVGIGTTAPDLKLKVKAPNQGGIAIEGPGTGVGAGLQFQAIGAGGRSWELLATGATSAQGEGKFNIRDLASARDDFTITSGGNIGVGTTAPSAKLEVNGDVRVTGDIFLTGADCAEEFDISEAVDIEPGTVMVITQESALQPSEQAYDKRVAGVVSGAGTYRSSITLDKQPSQNNRRPIALVGKVYCKVDAQYGPIEVGDLLTTSATLGHAMKASDPLEAFGAVIGKALRPLLSGQGLIPILIALQ
jgi:hypothetical protein